MSADLPNPEDSLAIELRDALALALADVLKRSKSSRDFARRMDMDKSLGWKLWRMATAPSAAALLRVFPKAHGVRTVLAAVRAKASSPTTANAVDRLAEKLLALRSASNRGTLAAAKASDAPQKQRTSVLSQLAARFEHDADAVGISIELRVGAFLLVPDASQERIDVAACVLVDGPRCYKSGVRAPVYSPLVAWMGKSAIRACGTSPKTLEGVPGLVPELSSRGLSAEQFVDFERRPNSPVREWAILPRPGVPETLAFLEVAPGIGNSWAKEPNDFGMVSMAITAPTRRAVLDLWVHRSMQMMDVTVSCREVQSVIPHPQSPSTALPSPFPDGVLLECRKPSLGSSLSEADRRYRALLERGAKALGVDLNEFRLLRASVRHPALGCCIAADWPLPSRP